MTNRYEVGSSGRPHNGSFLVPSPPPRESRRSIYERFVPAKGQALPSPPPRESRRSIYERFVPAKGKVLPMPLPSQRPRPQASRRSIYERFVPARGQAPPMPLPSQRPRPRSTGSDRSQNESMPRKRVSFSTENRAVPPSSSSFRSPLPTVVPTSAMKIRSSKHGRKRRKERHITKHQLQRALKFGTYKRTGRDGVVKYEHGGIALIFDHRTNTEVTSYATTKTSKPPRQPIT